MIMMKTHSLISYKGLAVFFQWFFVIAVEHKVPKTLLRSVKMWTVANAIHVGKYTGRPMDP